jgi:hypothetical protein
MKKLLAKQVVFFLVWLLIPTFGFCGPKELFVGDATLRIGMTLEEAQAAYKKSRFTIRKDDVPGGYTLISKKGPPYESPGMFSFDENGKLFWIGKSWGGFSGEQATSLGRTLFSILNNHKDKVFYLSTRQSGELWHTITSINLTSADGLS